MNVLVTGGNGQVGQALQSIADKYPELSFHFADSNDGDVSDKSKLQLLFSKYRPTFCINAAAYTAVDKAESEPENAKRINVDGARNIANVCRDYDCTLIHISTDFVFDGSKTTPYTEADLPNPQSVYGQTKLDGERAIQETLEAYFIIRTSWVYSEFGNNFMKTMLRLAAEREQLSVVDDQIGSPTNAVDLATVIVTIIESDAGRNDKTKPHYGIYNYSNDGQCSWYEFANAIFEFRKINVVLLPIPTTQFPTAAKRPAFSVLDKSKIRDIGIKLRPWTESLKDIQ